MLMIIPVLRERISVQNTIYIEENDHWKELVFWLSPRRWGEAVHLGGGGLGRILFMGKDFVCGT
jgi:hypothetical protein